MTDKGTFILTGPSARCLAARAFAGRVLHDPTSPGHGQALCGAKLIPNRGAWLEFEPSNRDILYVKVDRKRKIP